MNFGATELLIILAIILLLFGSTKVPQLARSLGESVKEFKNGMGNDSAAKKQHTSNEKTES